MTEKEALDFYENQKWLGWTDLQIAKFQFNEERLLIDINTFKGAVSNLLNRQISTADLVDPEIKKQVLALEETIQ